MTDGEDVQASGEGERGRRKQPGDPPKAATAARDDVQVMSVELCGWEGGGCMCGDALGCACVCVCVCMCVCMCVYVCVCVCVCVGVCSIN